MASFPTIDHQKALSYHLSLSKNIETSSLSHQKYQLAQIEMNARESDDQGRPLEKVSTKAFHERSQEDSEVDEMSQGSKRVKKETGSMNSYIKLTTEEVNLLEANFKIDNYPKIEEMQNMADKLGVSISKIENWFKHHRRSLAKKGRFDIKTKKYFKPHELKILMDLFKKTPRPSQAQMAVVAKQLNCTEYQIKNWYSNKRKRVKLHVRNNGNQIKYEEAESSFCPSSDSQNLPSENEIPIQRPHVEKSQSSPYEGPLCLSQNPSSFFLNQSESNEKLSQFLQSSNNFYTFPVVPNSSNSRLLKIHAGSFEAQDFLYKAQARARDQALLMKLWPNLNISNHANSMGLLSHEVPRNNFIINPPQSFRTPQYNIQNQINLTHPSLTFQQNNVLPASSLLTHQNFKFLNPINGLGYSGNGMISIQRGNYN